MKQGQLFAHPFIIIFALIVAVMILGFGFSTIIKLRDKADYAQLLETQEEIKEVARTFYTLGEESERTLRLRVPKDLKCFCFQDTVETGTFTKANIPHEPECGEGETKALIEARMLSSSSHQLFVTPLNAKKFPINSFILLKQLKPTQNPLCIKVKNSVFEAKITSRGSYVEITST